MKQLITLLLLIGLCPMWAKAQSLEEIRQAMDAANSDISAELEEGLKRLTVKEKTDD